MAEFQRLRQESRRGRRGSARAGDAIAVAAIRRQLATLERGQLALVGQLRELRKEIARPVRIKLY